ncbi:hypothetical protein [Tenacibaculum jejuense]|uniref:Uncharacterized protein n=1 Tax=Tenacibaculum jejuense TaxID=584609 RepID=A0A238U421_9FLAO|nr:hypothetical protein [Tenacibaculum jejuense]SNR13959.1 protein of unknown function [Tenacibaculum jejuense]
MKKRFTYVGYIKIEYQPLISLMREMLISSKVKERYAADIEKEINYKDEKLDIYIHEDGNNGFLIDIELLGSFVEANEFINNFTKKLREKNITHQFEWSGVGENDEEVGEEYEISFP